jgi:hypothetical protein
LEVPADHRRRDRVKDAFLREIRDRALVILEGAAPGDDDPVRTYPKDDDE